MGNFAMKTSGFVVFCVGAACLVACGSGTDPDSIRSIVSPVSLGTEGYWEVVRGAESNGLLAQATGAIQDYDDEEEQFFSCGATFISAKHAITAAHCVPHLAVGESITFKQYDTSALSQSTYEDYAQIVGTWPNWEHALEMTPAMGYTVTEYECVLERRCDPDYGGTENCPFNDDVDIAMLKCATRPDLSEWVDSEESAASVEGDNVEVFWFHELVDIPPTEDAVNHYALHEGSWHYDIEHQLLPLVSREHGGDHYSIVDESYDDDSTLFQTDVPVCHGTSGSGVFHEETGNFLGPMITGSTLADRLCEEMWVGPIYRSEAVLPQFTAQFADLPEVLWNRLPTTALMVAVL